MLKLVQSAAVLAVVLTATRARALGWDDIVWAQSHNILRHHTQGVALKKEVTAKRYGGSATPLFDVEAIVAKVTGVADANLAHVAAEDRGEIIELYQLAVMQAVKTGLAHDGKSADDENPGFSVWQLNHKPEVATFANIWFGITQEGGESASAPAFLSFFFHPNAQSDFDKAVVDVTDWIVGVVEGRGTPAAKRGAHASVAVLLNPTTHTAAQLKALAAKMDPVFKQAPSAHDHLIHLDPAVHTKASAENACYELNRYRLIRDQGAVKAAESAYPAWVSFCDKKLATEVRFTKG